MAWRVARSLETLLAQLNTCAPSRSKVSDGSIGDAAHSSRTSDHNPNPAGVVCARDFTHDPAGGLDCDELAADLVGSADPRIKYLIWDRRIWNPDYGYWRPYSGVNPHTQHLHLSVDGPVDDDRPWALPRVTADRPVDGPPPSRPEPAPEREPAVPVPPAADRSLDVDLIDLSKATDPARSVTGRGVRPLQRLLGVPADGYGGPATRAALGKAQKRVGTTVDYVFGPDTAGRLLAEA